MPERRDAPAAANNRLAVGDRVRHCMSGWTGIVAEIRDDDSGMRGIGIRPAALDWTDPAGEAVIGGGINSGECVGRRKIEKREASRTPIAFRDVLLGMARAVWVETLRGPAEVAA